MKFRSTTFVDKSTLVQVMARCHQATHHYLSLCCHMVSIRHNELNCSSQMLKFLLVQVMAWWQLAPQQINCIVPIWSEWFQFKVFFTDYVFPYWENLKQLVHGGFWRHAVLEHADCVVVQVVVGGDPSQRLRCDGVVVLEAMKEIINWVVLEATRNHEILQVFFFPL